MSDPAPLPRSTPEAQGVRSAAVDVLVRRLDAMDAVHSVTLLRHGAVIAEGWWGPYSPERPHALYSVSKSFTSAAVGLAVAEGLFEVDDRVVDLLPHDLPADPDPRLARLTVRHLLTMTSGHGGAGFDPRVDTTVAGAIATPFTDEPGSRFVYDTGDTFLAGAIVQRRTGGSLLDYLGPRLFAPLGIVPGWWDRSADGLELAGTGLGLTTDALARFGLLLLQSGRWEGRQLLPEEWVATATAFQVPNGGPDENPDWSQGYGWQFWRCRHDAFRADGAFGQFVVVLPEQDAVLAVTAGLTDMQGVLDALWALLPAFGDPIPDDGEASGALAERLASLRLPAVEGSGSSAAAFALDGAVWTVDGAPERIRELRLDPTPGGWRLRAARADAVDELPIGAGTWAHGRSTLLTGEPTDVAASGAWVGDEFRARFALLPTPFRIDVALRVDGSELAVTVQQNLAMGGSTDPVRLHASRDTPHTDG